MNGTSPINRQPRGLLDFFGIRSGGRQPQQLTEQLLPTINLDRWYKENQVLTVTFTAPAAGFVADALSATIGIPSTGPVNLGNGTNVTVPQNEVWVVMPGGTHIRAVMDDASHSIDVGLAHFSQGLAINLWPVRNYGPTTGTAGNNHARASVLTQEVWLAPGDIVRGFQTGVEVAAGTIMVFGTLRIVRLRV